MHPALQNLTQDHCAIKPGLELMEVAAGQLLAGEPVDSSFVNWMVTVIGRFADGYHYRKEEDFLGRALSATRDFGGPWAAQAFQADHALTRHHLGQVRRALRQSDYGGPEARREVATALVAYCAAMRYQLAHEEQAYLPLVEHLLDPEELNLLGLAFMGVDAELAASKEPVVYETEPEFVTSAAAR